MLAVNNPLLIKMPANSGGWDYIFLGQIRKIYQSPDRTACIVYSDGKREKLTEEQFNYLCPELIRLESFCTEVYLHHQESNSENKS